MDGPANAFARTDSGSGRGCQRAHVAVAMTKPTVIRDDAHEALGRVAPGSVDAVATDPQIWTLCLRTPGAHLLAFGGTRTFHRLATAIEDGG